MTSQEKLQRDIDTLRESIKLDWQDIATNQLSANDKKGIKQHIQLCIDELKNLNERLETEI